MAGSRPWAAHRPSWSITGSVMGFGMAVAVLVLIVGLKKVSPKIPGALLGVIGAAMTIEAIAAIRARAKGRKIGTNGN